MAATEVPDVPECVLPPGVTPAKLYCEEKLDEKSVAARVKELRESMHAHVETVFPKSGDFDVDGQAAFAVWDEFAFTGNPDLRDMETDVLGEGCFRFKEGPGFQKALENLAKEEIAIALKKRKADDQVGGKRGKRQKV